MLMEILFAAAIANGVPVSKLQALCWVESKHNPKAIVRNDGGSPSYGMCQVKLATARHMGFKGRAPDLLKPDINADIAAKYLRYQLARYGSMEKALSAYNAGRYIKANRGYVAKVYKAERLFRNEVACR